MAPPAGGRKSSSNVPSTFREGGECKKSIQGDSSTTLATKSQDCLPKETVFQIPTRSIAVRYSVTDPFLRLPKKQPKILVQRAQKVRIRRAFVNLIKDHLSHPRPRGAPLQRAHAGPRRRFFEIPP